MLIHLDSNRPWKILVSVHKRLRKSKYYIYFNFNMIYNLERKRILRKEDWIPRLLSYDSNIINQD